jgi:hypothetical protein
MAGLMPSELSAFLVTLKKKPQKPRLVSFSQIVSGGILANEANYLIFCDEPRITALLRGPGCAASLGPEQTGADPAGDLV